MDSDVSCKPRAGLLAWAWSLRPFEDGLAIIPGQALGAWASVCVNLELELAIEKKNRPSRGSELRFRVGLCIPMDRDKSALKPGLEGLAWL
jgi:hypothetical protein